MSVYKVPAGWEWRQWIAVRLFDAVALLPISAERGSLWQARIMDTLLVRVSGK